jgi:hypothetical protein
VLVMTASARQPEGSTVRVWEPAVVVPDVRRALLLPSERFVAVWSVERLGHLEEAERMELRALLSEMVVSALWEGWG